MSKTCFGDDKRVSDYLGLMSFGIFVLVLGVVFVANPNVVTDLRLWIEASIADKTLTRPSEALLTSITVFFGLIGVSNFFKASVRLGVKKDREHFFSDTLWGVATVLFACLVHLYKSRVLTWQMVFALEAVVCGLLVILYSTVLFAFHKRRHTIKPENAAPAK